MFDQWDDDTEPTAGLSWQRRCFGRCGLCASLTLIMGFVLGWTAAVLRSSEESTYQRPASARTLPGEPLPAAVSIAVPEPPVQADTPVAIHQPTNPHQHRAEQ
jgi:hypothetical protein